MKIAIASTNNIYVDQHFGHAKEFYIYQLTNNQLKFIEKREVHPYCNRENCATHDFAKNRFDNVLNALIDCKKIYVSLIGNKPANELIKKGIEVEIYEGAIKDLIKINK